MRSRRFCTVLLQGLFLSGEVTPANAKVADCIKPLSGIDHRPLPGDGCRALAAHQNFILTLCAASQMTGSRPRDVSQLV